MIVQEPVQAAIWHCLNHYDYTDAVFLSERLYAEVKTDDSLFLLATAYYRNGQRDHAYHILKEGVDNSAQCKYLFGICAYELGKYAEAESVLLQSENLDDIVTEYGDQASFALALLGKIAVRTERKQAACEAWKRALKLNPFLWSTFESLCKIGEKPNPNTTFQLNGVENFSMCNGTNLNNIESVIITQQTSNNQETQDTAPSFVTPPQILTNLYSNRNNINLRLFTPDASPLPDTLWMSGFKPLSTLKSARSKLRIDPDSPAPTFGHLMDNNSDGYNLTPNITTLSESNVQQSLTKRLRNQVDSYAPKKDNIMQNCKSVFTQSMNVPVPKTPTIPLSVQAAQNVRRSSRLFSSSYSVKENNKSPNRSKFATPKSPSRKTKQRLTKCNLNKTPNYAEMNNKNKNEKEKSETITSNDLKPSNEKGAITNNVMDHCIHQAFMLQKNSAEGLMYLLRTLGQAYINLQTFNCKATIEELNNLPSNQFQTCWVYSMLGLAHFELAEYDACIKYFQEVHNKEPYRIEYMDVYSTALWHLQKEVALSVLAQDLINFDKKSPITWCVSGNCFSLHKEHDIAIKFFQRAVQVDPEFPYAYTLLGHEYITTEDLDKAMSCFRNAIRLDSRHYNAWFGIGTIYSKQERYHLAEINYSRALSINPQSSVILCHIGVVQHALKQTEKALQTLNTAIANNPKSPLCKFHRGSIYFASGRHAEALKELEELKEIVPKESLVYYLIGKVHKKLGNTDLALMHFSWATDLDPKGASSQIKEAFDPGVGRNSSTVESPTSPTVEESNSEGTSGQQQDLGFLDLPDDSEDSF